VSVKLKLNGTAIKLKDGSPAVFMLSNSTLLMASYDFIKNYRISTLCRIAYLLCVLAYIPA